MTARLANSKHPTKAEIGSLNHQERNVLAPIPIVAKGENRKKSLSLYEDALKRMQIGKYEKAYVLFGEMLPDAPSDLADRIRMYMAACLPQISKSPISFETSEEQYDYAVSLLNRGQYDDARQQLKAILGGNSTADYAIYGLAIVAGMTGDTKKCLEHLSEAIRLNAQYRIQARSDPDFDDLADDPRFTELIYPEN